MACPWNRSKWPNDPPACECGRNRGGDCDGRILPVVAYAQGQQTAEALAYAAGVDAFMDGKDLDAVVASVDPSMIEIAVVAYLSVEWADLWDRDTGPPDIDMASIITWAMDHQQRLAAAGASIRAAADAIALAVRGPAPQSAGRVVYRRPARCRHAA